MKAMHSLVRASLCALLAAATLPAQPKLLSSIKLDRQSMSATFQVERGSANGSAWLVFAPSHLLVPPILTPWGKLYLAPSNVVPVGPLQLDPMGTATLSFQVRQPLPGFVLSVQAAILGGNNRSLDLTNPVAMGGAATQVLSYQDGKFEATVIGEKDEEVSVRAANDNNAETELAYGKVPSDGGTVTLKGNVPAQVDGRDTKMVKLYRGTRLVCFVYC